MKKIFVLAVAVCVMPCVVQAKFSANICDDIAQCCNGFDNSDDSDEMEAACCGSYRGAEFYDCWDVCVRGASSQYCEEQSGDAYHCQPGQGYDEIKSRCETCSSGYYSELATWQGEYGDFITDYTCRRCPAFSGMYGTTAGAGSTSIAACYIPSGCTFSDTTGGGEYAENCYWQ